MVVKHRREHCIALTDAVEAEISYIAQDAESRVTAAL